MRVLISILFILQIFESAKAQTFPLLSAIRSPYFILNSGQDSSLIPGLKNKSTQIIYLLFSAEEDPIGLDPGLSTDGRWRAINLMNILKEQEIAAFFSTPFRRNILTIQPLCEYLKMGTNYYDQSDLKSLYDQIDKYKPFEIVVMVHKETLPKIMEHYLGRPFVENVENQPSDRIFVLERPLKGTPNLRNYRYNIR